MSGYTAQFAVPYPRPTRLSDPHHDFSRDALSRLLHVPDHSLKWHHFRNLLGPFLPAGTYEESVYYLPLAFAYILEHDEDALDLVTSLIWFCSEYANNLDQDRILEHARWSLEECLEHWTAKFHVTHYDLEACRTKGWRLAYCDNVSNQEVVCQATCDLVRFDRHADIAHHFIHNLAKTAGAAIRAAWFLEYSRSRFDVYKPPEVQPIQNLICDAGLLQRAADTVRGDSEMLALSPTYWRDTFAALGVLPLTDV